MRISDWSSDVCSSDLLVAGQSDTQFWVVSDDPHFTYGKPDTLAALKSVPDADGFSDEGRRHSPLRSLARTIPADEERPTVRMIVATDPDRKSKRLNSSH